MLPSLTLTLDIVILILLGATIFYAIKLSKHLDDFRKNRGDMESLIRDLSVQITRAQEGISVLDQLAKESSDELRSLIGRGKELSDELQLITQSGDNMASRLEDLATRTRKLVEEMEQKAIDVTYPKARLNENDVSNSPFAIRDPDLEPSTAKSKLWIEDDEDIFQGSQSEKDLAKALQKRRKLGEGA
jgi:chromosome segregation ATPase